MRNPGVKLEGLLPSGICNIDRISMASKEKENYGKNESLHETTSKQTPNGAVAPPTVEGNLGNLENLSGERNSLRYNIRELN